MGNEVDFYHENKHAPVHKTKSSSMTQNTIYSQDKPFENYESNIQFI